MIKLSVCIAGFLSAIVISCAIFYFTQINSVGDLEDLSTFWYFLGGGALAGITLGLLLAKFDRVGVAVLAGWGGFCAGLILVEVAFAYT